MNDAQPDGEDMTMQVLDDSLEFLRKNNLGTMLIVSGGEPTEHRNFDEIMNRIIDFSTESGCIMFITVTTNGELIQNDSERFQGYIKRAKNGRNSVELVYQVSADVRYYPRRIQTYKRIFREDGFVLCDDCVEQIYPQGRALDNNIPWKSKASKCFNVRAISKQIPMSASLHDIESTLAQRGYFCTPHIDVHGNIKLGESDLCPVCASIYDSMEDIMEKIRKFKCNQCEHINKNLNDIYKLLL
jgi:organic radical activating enzyme